MNVLAIDPALTAEQTTTHAIALATAEQWLAIFDGEVPPRLVNPGAWPRYCERFEELLGLRPAECP